MRIRLTAPACTSCSSPTRMAWPIPNYMSFLIAHSFTSAKPKDRLRRRIQEHLRSGRTGSSTLRRSLGAVLADKLRLKARPRRKPPRNDKDFQNYCFDAEGEDRLTRWMLDHLEVAWMECASSEEVERTEADLVLRRAPVLNINNNPNSPYAPTVRKRREHCRHQARCDP